VFAAWRRLREDRRGSVLFEGTILVPVMVTLFLGVFKFSWNFFNQQLVHSGILLKRCRRVCYGCHLFGS